jgi:hypothetical protein
MLSYFIIMMFIIWHYNENKLMTNKPFLLCSQCAQLLLVLWNVFMGVGALTIQVQQPWVYVMGIMN